MGHGHPHTHDAGHGRAFAMSVGLNVIFVAVEVAFGLLSGSMALVADAAHNLGDVLGLGLAWGAMHLARSTPTDQRTYGWRKSTVLAALLNAVFIMIAVGGVGWEAIERLQRPTPIDGWVVVVVAAIGTGINGASAALFLSGRHRDVNLRGAFLHLASDAAVSLGVVVAGAVYIATGWTWVDPVTSLAIAVVIVFSTWGLLRESVALLMDAVPAHIDLSEVRECLCSIEGVRAIHDLHVWALSTRETSLTAHLEMDERATSSEILRAIEDRLRRDFDIAHTTVQLEPKQIAADCPQGRPGRI